MGARAWLSLAWRAGLGLPVALAVTVVATAGGASPVPTLTALEVAAPAPGTHSVSSTPCSPSAKVCLDLSSQRAWLTDGAGHIIYGPVPARGGSKNAKTPKGTFSVLSKNAHFYSTEFHAPMPYSVFFYPGDAFHAGNPATASNGCVHLSMAAAQRFFATLRPGDKVQIK
jgi:hypothetical protein